MLNDRTRTGAYVDAIREVVRPNDVVVELGTGTGVLAVAAAMAGAGHVYTIEVGSIGEVAKAVFEANGLSDRITLITGMSSHVDLPERADVLVSEIIGNEALSEGVLQSTKDAIRRFLKPEARFVPHRLRIYAIAVTVPESVMGRYFFRESSEAIWKDWYGVDFAPLSQGNPPDSYRIFARPHRPRDWVRMSEPVLLAEIDFPTGHSPHIVSENTIVAKEGGLINGIVEYFDLGLSPSVELSVNPETVSEDCSWRLPVWLLGSPLEVVAGERLTVKYEYGAGDRHGWVSITRDTLNSPQPASG